MVALKLHTWQSSDRDPEKAGHDWLDMRKIIKLHEVGPNEDTVVCLIRRCGGDEGLECIRHLCQS